MEEIPEKCRIIPLYRYEITYHSGDKDQYDCIIITDSIKRLVEQIVIRELVYSMKDCRKYFTISTFLTYIANDGIGRLQDHRVYDIFDHNIAGIGSNMISESYYICSFSEKGPQSVDIKVFDYACMELHVLNDENISYGNLLGEWLYDSIPVKQAIESKQREYDAINLKEKHAAHKALQNIAGLSGLNFF